MKNEAIMEVKRAWMNNKATMEMQRKQSNSRGAEWRYSASKRVRNEGEGLKYFLT